MTNEKLTRFNIALLPSAPALSAECTDLARRYLGQYADGYLLGDQALPHITLCQFSAISKDLKQIAPWLTRLESEHLLLNFHHVYLWSHQEPGTGFVWIWAGLAISQSKLLSDM